MSVSLTGSCTLSTLNIKQPTEVDGYLIVARDLMQGVDALSTISNIHPRSCALLAAHAAECALKAFLWHKGKKVEIRNKDIRHNLEKLWELAYNENLGISKVPCEWVSILSVGHGPNYYFRYQEGEGRIVVHGGQMPPLIPMAAELKNLIEKVEKSINK